jgi:hypothetical protein
MMVSDSLDVNHFGLEIPSKYRAMITGRTCNVTMSYKDETSRRKAKKFIDIIESKLGKHCLFIDDGRDETLSDIQYMQKRNEKMYLNLKEYKDNNLEGIFGGAHLYGLTKETPLSEVFHLFLINISEIIASSDLKVFEKDWEDPNEFEVFKVQCEFLRSDRVYQFTDEVIQLGADGYSKKLDKAVDMLGVPEILKILRHIQGQLAQKPSEIIFSQIVNKPSNIKITSKRKDGFEIDEQLEEKGLTQDRKRKKVGVII